MGPYSGQGKGPLHGDFEAQRHWMELTNHLPVDQWYFYDLEYWGLDYPPLTAYHMRLCGYVGGLFNPEWFAFVTSRGIETAESKIFMRLTVIISDLVVYLPACILVREKFGRGAFLALLLNPALLLVDHGHFQFNGVSLGLFLIALCLVVSDKLSSRVCGCIFFTMALMYKQMELYHSFAFFFVLIGFALKRNSIGGKLFEIVLYGIVVISTMIICLLPFLLTDDPVKQISQILFRLFPFGRGLFEDKVSNVWCTLHLAFKLRTKLDPALQLKLATGCTLIFAVLPCLKLLKCQKPKTMANACAASSLAFFLFSFQVHEKQALLFITPALLTLDCSVMFNLFFLHSTFFSLMPLFQKDLLLHHYFALRIFSYGILILSRGLISDDIKRIEKVVPGMLTGNRFGGFATPLGAVVFFQELLLYLTMYQKPPSRLPDIWPVIISALSCAIFVLFYISYLIFMATELTEPPKRNLRNPYAKVQKSVEEKKTQ